MFMGTVKKINQGACYLLVLPEIPRSCNQGACYLLPSWYSQRFPAAAPVFPEMPHAAPMLTPPCAAIHIVGRGRFGLRQARCGGAPVLVLIYFSASLLRPCHGTS
jgi:hypothetical protein